MNDDGSFHVPKGCQNDPLYWSQRPKPFLCRSVSVFLLHGLSFRLKLVIATPLFFFAKIYFSVHVTHFSVNFTWFALLSQQKFNDRLLFKLGELFDFLLFQIDSEQIFWQRKLFCYFQPIAYFLNKPYIYIYIYAN